jgi:hypothetical protein
LSLKNDITQFGAGGFVGQMKLLGLEADSDRTPGFAAIAGVTAPWGSGGFEAPDWSPFVYFAATLLLRENLVALHGNFGFFFVPGALETYFGLASEVGLGRFRVIAEVYSGDPHGARVGNAVQGGFRFVITETVQLDVTAGTGLGSPSLSPYATLGIRLVRPELW